MRPAKSIFISTIFIECLFTFVDSGGQTERFDGIKILPNDNRSYRGLILPNKLKVMLVSDPSTSKSAASMVVGVGSLQDFKHVDGLALLMACLLRRKSPKYPEPNNYEKFIAKNGGETYLQVFDDQQTFAFEVNPEEFIPALDRLAQFFRRSSLEDLNEEDLDATVAAVEGDYQKCKNKDEERIKEVERLLSKENHKYNHFCHGNRQTLYHLPGKKTLLKNVKLFHSQFYSSRIMTLTVLGKESLNSLESLVTSLFRRIEDKDVTLLTYKGPFHPWQPDQLRRKVYIVPKDEKLQILRLRFPIPDVPSQEETTVRYFVSHQLLYSGPGSLKSILEKRKLCHNIRAIHQEPAGIGFLCIECDLTDDGVKRVNEVIRLIFQCLYLLSDRGSPEYLIDNMRKMNEANPVFGSNFIKRPLIYVRLISMALRFYKQVPIEEIVLAIRGHYIVNTKDWSRVKMLLCYLKPDNVNVTIVSKSFEGQTNQTEQYYGTPYKIEDIPEEQIDALFEFEGSDELKLAPPNNKFLPKNAKLQSIDPKEPKYPYLIHQTSTMEIWFKQDHEFRVPWQHRRLTYRNTFCLRPQSTLNPFISSAWNIFWICQNRILMEYMHAAHDAGFKIIYEPMDQGGQIHIYGHSETMLLFLKEFFKKSSSLGVKMNVERFTEAKSVKMKSLQDIYNDRQNIETRVTWYRDNFFFPHGLSTEVSFFATKTVQLDHVKELSEKWLSLVFLRAFVHGNYNRERAKNIVNVLQNLFKPKREFLPQETVVPRAVQMEDGSHYIFQTFKKGIRRYSYLTFFQFNPEPSVVNEVLNSLLVQIILSFCESNLKGFLPYGKCIKMENHKSLVELTIMTEYVAFPRVVDKNVKQFLEAAFSALKRMTIGELVQHKDRLKKTRSVKPAELFSSDSYWHEISRQSFQFDEGFEMYATELRSVKKPHLIAFFKEYFVNRRSELTILEFPEGTSSTVTNDIPEGAIRIEDFTAFKNCSILLPNYI